MKPTACPTCKCVYGTTDCVPGVHVYGLRTVRQWHRNCADKYRALANELRASDVANNCKSHIKHYDKTADMHHGFAVLLDEHLLYQHWEPVPFNTLSYTAQFVCDSDEVQP